MKVTKITKQLHTKNCFTMPLKAERETGLQPTDTDQVIAFFTAKEKRDLGFTILTKFNGWNYCYQDGWHIHYPKGQVLKTLLSLPNNKRVRHQEANSGAMVIYLF